MLHGLSPQLRFGFPGPGDKGTGIDELYGLFILTFKGSGLLEHVQMLERNTSQKRRIKFSTSIWEGISFRMFSWAYPLAYRCQFLGFTLWKYQRKYANMDVYNCKIATITYGTTSREGAK